MLDIEVTDRAVEQIRLIQKSDVEAAKAFLRIQIVGSGPEGPRFKLGFDNQAPMKDDKSYERSSITVVADSRTALFLSGSTLDFVEGIAGSGFIFRPESER